MKQKKHYGRIGEHLIVALLLVFTFWIFYPSIHCELLNWDDTLTIINNKYIKSLSAQNILAIFTSLDFYQPLVNLTYAVEYHFFGYSPLVYHATNVFLHLLNVLMVFCFIRLISEKFAVALICAALFAVHPLRVESVTWASERKDVLYALFLFLSLIFYTKYSKSQIINHKSKWVFYSFSLFFLLLSLLSKVMAATSWIMFIFIDVFGGRKFNKSAFLDKIPFISLSTFVITFSLSDIAQAENIVYSNFNFIERIQNSSYAALWYIYKTFAPLNLSVYYTFPDFNTGNYPLWFLLFPLLFFSVIVLWCYFGFIKGKREIAFGFGFYIAAIILTIQLWPFGMLLVADRYSYVASVGLFYIAGEYLNRLCHKFFPTHNTVMLFFVCLILILPLSYLSSERIGAWKNSISLWTDAIEKNPSEPLAHYNRGSAHAGNGDFAKAIDDFSKAIEVDSNYSSAYYNRGNVYALLKQYDLAEKDFTKAIELNPKNGRNYMKRADVYISAKDFKRALPDYNMAISLGEHDPTAYFNRAGVWISLGQRDSACADWQRATAMGHKKAAELLMKFCK